MSLSKVDQAKLQAGATPKQTRPLAPAPPAGVEHTPGFKEAQAFAAQMTQPIPAATTAGEIVVAAGAPGIAENSRTPGNGDTEPEIDKVPAAVPDTTTITLVPSVSVKEGRAHRVDAATPQTVGGDKTFWVTAQIAKRLRAFRRLPQGLPATAIVAYALERLFELKSDETLATDLAKFGLRRADKVTRKQLNAFVPASALRRLITLRDDHELADSVVVEHALELLFSNATTEEIATVLRARGFKMRTPRAYAHPVPEAEEEVPSS